MDSGNFSWGTEGQTRKTRIVDVVYNASNNELGRKKNKKLSEADEAVLNQKRSGKTMKKFKERQKLAKVEDALTEQFMTGRLLACISSRPGQVGRCDGYILEGKELEFYLRKIKAKKNK